MKTVFIQADDLGMSEGINRAALELFEAGVLSGAGVMMALCEPFFPEQESFLPFRNRLGLHLQLTEGAPLSLLRGSDERVLQSFPQKDQVHLLSPESVEIEWRRQWDRFRDVFGQNPTRLDSHHGVHMLQGLFPVARKLAHEMGVPLRGDVHHNGVLEDVLSDWTGQSLSGERLMQMVLDSPSSHVEVVCHPGWDNHTLEGLTGWTDVRAQDVDGLFGFLRRVQASDDSVVFAHEAKPV